MENDPAFLTQRQLAQREIDRQVLEGMIAQERQDIIDDPREIAEIMTDYWHELAPMVSRQVKRLHGPFSLEQTHDLARRMDEIIKARAKLRAERRFERRE